MSWEQDPWSVPGGIYAPRRRGTVRDRGGFGGSGSRGSGGRGYGRGRGSGGVRWLWIPVVCLIGLAGWNLIFGENGTIRLKKLRAREAALNVDIAEARARVKDLDGQAADINKTREIILRQKYGMARKNEMVYETVDSGSVRIGEGAGEGAGTGSDEERSADRP